MTRKDPTVSTNERLTDAELEALIDALVIMRDELITGLNFADARIDLPHALAAVRELRARRAAEAAAPAHQDAAARLGALAVAGRRVLDMVQVFPVGDKWATAIASDKEELAHALGALRSALEAING